MVTPSPPKWFSTTMFTTSRMAASSRLPQSPPISLLNYVLTTNYTPFEWKTNFKNHSYPLYTPHTVNWEQVQVATSSDENMVLLLSAVEDGLPEVKHQLPPPIREFHQFRGHLYSSVGVVIYKDHIVIPPSLRPTCLSALNAAHQGTSAMTAKVEASIFWQGITNDIQATRENCPHCNRMAPSQAALPPTLPTLPEYPFQCICADYFLYQGHTYLVIVDRYSNWPIVERADNGALSRHLKKTDALTVSGTYCRICTMESFTFKSDNIFFIEHSATGAKGIFWNADIFEPDGTKLESAFTQVCRFVLVNARHSQCFS